MPWPFDKYKHPAAAKYWLSKYPKTAPEEDEYADEMVYLDELEERIENFHAKFQNSERFDQLYNEFGWHDHEPVTKAYPQISNGKADAREFGRGKKVNPAWYMSPEYIKVPRVALKPLQHMSGHMAQNTGRLAALKELPPEEPSIFKFWNSYHIWGMLMTVLVTKEYFILAAGHDLFHAVMLWGFFSVITGAFVNWWQWWFALRGQEYYDIKFFPLNDKVETLYKSLATMEEAGSQQKMMLAFQKYEDDLAQRVLDRGLLVKKRDFENSIFAKLEAKARAEDQEVTQANSEWATNAMTETDAFFNDDKVQGDYMKTAMSSFKTGDAAVLRPATEQTGSSSSVFADKYKSTYDAVKAKWLADKKKDGSLPWGLASAADLKAGSMSDADKQKAIDALTNDLRKKYHTFA